MKRLGLLLLVVVFFFSFPSCDILTAPEETNPVEPLPALSISWTPKTPIVCFGTSLTYGFIWNRYFGPVTSRDIVSKPEIPPFSVSSTIKTLDNNTWSYPYQLGLTLRIPVVNEGFVGARTDQALAVMRDSVISKNPCLVLLEYPANDMLQSVPVTLAGERLGMIVDSLQQAGATVVLISYIYPEMIKSIPANHYLSGQEALGFAYLEMMKNVAREHGIQFVEYAMFGIYWNEDLMSDALHPNEKGYKIMETNISRALLNTFDQNSMLKDVR